MKKQSIIRNAKAKGKAVSMIVQGATGREVGKAFGIHESNVSRFRSKEEIRELIAQERARIMDENLSKAVDNVKHLIHEMDTLSPEMHQARGLSYKATRDLLTASTLYPSQGNMTQINFFSEEQSEIVSDETVKLLLRGLNCPDKEQEPVDNRIIDLTQESASDK